MAFSSWASIDEDGALPPFMIEEGEVPWVIPDPNCMVRLIWDFYETCINLDLEVFAGVYEVIGDWVLFVSWPTLMFAPWEEVNIGFIIEEL